MMRDILVMDCGDRETFWVTLKSDSKIHFAATAGEGLKMISESIGLIFLNLKLLDGNGMEALRLIKKEYPLAEIIAIASCGTEEACMEAFRKGASDCITKPLKTEEVLQKIETLVNTKDASQGHKPASLSAEPVKEEAYNNIPSHLISGIIKVRDFIAQNYSETLSLSAACKMASISKTYFCYFFKLITGYSLRRYHHIIKIRRADELLKDKRLSITDVAELLGYDDSNYFSTIYKKITGFSPREWQSSYRNVYKEEEPRAAETARETESTFICKKSLAVSPKCRKAAVQGLDKIKKFGKELENTLEYIEP